METVLLRDERTVQAYSNRSGLFAYVIGEPDKSCNSSLKVHIYETGATFLLFPGSQHISNTVGFCLVLVFTVVTLQ